jgi:5-methylcytosine-specific restriction enzyme B
MLKIWFVLKQMGLTRTNPVLVTTSSPDEALKKLFSYSDPSRDFFVPFAHTRRFMTMKHDAGRSIIQTSVNRWIDKTVVETDPTSYLGVTKASGGISVSTTRRYPIGLGYGKNGFALEDGAHVQVPDLAFAVWYYRQSDLTDTSPEAIIARLRHDLQLEPSEIEAIFGLDRNWTPTFQSSQLTDAELNGLVTGFLDSAKQKQQIKIEAEQQYKVRIYSTMSLPEGPQWLREDPGKQLQQLLSAGTKAVLLFGPPRTGKTRAVDKAVPRSDQRRVTIQIHDGWGYDELMLSFRPNEKGEWVWTDGPLLQAIRDGKEYIVLEELNRTQATQALGEVFSLLEQQYRGQACALKLRNGDSFYLPENTIVIATMNTLDKSTEDLDDALLGRFAGIEYPPRVEDLIEMLTTKKVPKEIIAKLAELFATITQVYPLGHGYFAELNGNQDVISYYRARVRPVLNSHLKGYRDNELANVDEKVDQLFRS